MSEFKPKKLYKKLKYIQNARASGKVNLLHLVTNIYWAPPCAQHYPGHQDQAGKPLA